MILLQLSDVRPLTTSGQPSQTIKSSSTLVLVPVSVLDKSGHFIPDLTAKDFRILVDGKPVAIVNFDAVSGPALSPAQSTKPAVSGVFRNIPTTLVLQPHLTIFLIDYLNTRLADRMALRDQLLQFFANRLQPNAQISIFGLTHSLVLIQTFTQNSADLIAVAKNLLQQKGQPSDPKESVQLDRPGSDRSAVAILNKKGTDAVIEYFTLLNARREYNFDQQHRTTATLAAFRQLAGAFGGIPCKKTIIWLTGDASPLSPTLMYRNLPFDISVQTPGTESWAVQQVIQALNAAAVSVFPVDIPGVINTGTRDADSASTHSDFLQSLAGSQPVDTTPYNQTSDMREGEAARSLVAMDVVASETGGIRLAGSNDIGQLLDRAQMLWASYYVLSLAPEKSDSIKESYHHIQVKVNRDGVHMLARRGYVTRPDSLVASKSEIQRDLLEASSSPIDLATLALRLKLGTREESQARHFPFSLVTSGAALVPAKDGRATYDLSVLVLVEDQDGKVVSSVAKHLQDVLSESDANGAEQHGLAYASEFAVPRSGTFFGRVIVRDNTTGRLGTITVTLNPAIAR
jgi:VWFA-related protein